MSQTIENQPTTTTKARTSPRERVARWILFYHFALIVVAAVCYLFGGFDREEFTSLMGMLAPITALYGGVVFKYLSRTISENVNLSAELPLPKLVDWLVHGHFIAVLALISAKALFNFMNFEDLTMFLTFVEAGLGVYMGGILMAVFEKRTD